MPCSLCFLFPYLYYAEFVFLLPKANCCTLLYEQNHPKKAFRVSTNVGSGILNSIETNQIQSSRLNAHAQLSYISLELLEILSNLTPKINLQSSLQKVRNFDHRARRQKPSQNL